MLGFADAIIHSSWILDTHWRRDSAEPPKQDACAAGMLDIPLSDMLMLSSEEASTQNTCDNLEYKINSAVKGNVKTINYLSDISSVNLRQIWVFPIPPVPQRRQERLNINSLSAPWTKIFPSLSSTSFCPVNSGLEFGLRDLGIFICTLPVLAGWTLLN